MTDSLYSAARFVYTLPNRVDARTQQLVKNKSAGIQKNTIQGIGFLARSCVQHDYCAFANTEMGGRFKSFLAEPPLGPLIILLYGPTIIGRLWRAYQRGKEDHDYREVYDILRRDVTAVTFLIFALPPVVRFLSAKMSHMSKVNLIDNHSDQVLKYSQLENYKIDSGKALKAIILEGHKEGKSNGEALIKAVSGLHDHEISKYDGGRVETQLKTLKTKVENCVRKLPHLGDKEAHQLANETFQAFEKTQQVFREAGKMAHQQNALKVAQNAEKLAANVSNVLVNYAQARRVPVDIMGFIIMVGLIGFLPVYFNSIWNAWSFKREHRYSDPSGDFFNA